jgi:histidine triad (HIT) family protein
MREAPPENIFGRILRGELPSYCIYDDAAVFAFLDIYPQAPGHALVIPRSYAENLLVADEAMLVSILRVVQRLATAIQLATGAPGVTVLTNTGLEAGQMIEYLHWHIIPRRKGDEVELHRLGAAAAHGELAAMAERIRSAVDKEGLE